MGGLFRSRGGLLADGALGRLAPELLEAVEVPRLGREDVHDDVEVVHEDPAGLVDALDAAGQEPVVVLEPLADAVVDRLRLPVRVAGADDEVVRVAQHAPEVELDDVDRLLVGGVVLDEGGQAGALELDCGVAHAYSPSRAMWPATASGTRYRMGSPAAMRSRTMVDETSMRGMAKKRMRSGTPDRPDSAARIAWRPTPSRAATPSSARERMASGSRHEGIEWAMSPPTMKVS